MHFKNCTQLQVICYEKMVAADHLIVAVAFLTFGAISPDHEIWTNLQDKGDNQSMRKIVPHRDYQSGLPIHFRMKSRSTAQIESSFVTTAKEQAYMKFGTKIGPVIGNEFDDVIFPKIEEAIQMTLAQAGDLHKRKLAISEKTSR